MKKLSILSLIIILSITLISVEVLATGISLTGIGGRGTVFGGAFRGISNDWSAAYWNPAGLVQVQRMQIGGDLEFISPTSCYSPALFMGGNFGTLDAMEKDCEDNKFWVPAGGFVYSTGKMAFGLSVFAPFGLGVTWDLFNTNNYNSSYPNPDYDDNLKIIDIHPTFAYQVSDKLSIGVGVSILHSDITIQMPRMTPNPYFFDPAAEALKLGFLGNGGTFTDANKHIMTDLNLEGSGLGFGGNIGIQYKATEDFHIGVSARYYADQELEGSFVAKTYFVNEPMNNAVNQAVLNGALQGGLIDQATYARSIGLFSGASATTISDKNVTAKVPLPMNIGVGFAYYGIENFMLSMDVDFTQYSSFDVIDIEFADGGKEQLVENWEDVIRIAFGFEYMMNKLKLRGSYYTENSATINETFTPSIPDVGRRNVIIGGFGYSFGQIEFHAHGEYIFVADRTVDTWELNQSQNGYENFAGTFSASTFTLMAGFEFNF